jgi:hypothetical protein
MAESAVIGALRVVLGADTAAFETGLKGASNRMDGFAKDMAKMGAAVGLAIAGAAVAIGVAVGRALDEADKLGKAAQKIGIPVEELSKLKFAAELADVSIEQLQTGVSKLSRAMSEISGGKTSGAAAEAFTALRIKVTDANGKLKATDDILLEIAGKFEGFRDGAEKTALAVALFGKSGADLIPFLNQGATGITALKKQAEDLGIVIDEKTAKAAEQFNDNLKTLGKLSDAATISIAAFLAPALALLTSKLIEVQIEGTKTNTVMSVIGEVLAKSFPGIAAAIKATAAAMAGAQTESLGLQLGVEALDNKIKEFGKEKPPAPVLIDRAKLEADRKAAVDAMATIEAEQLAIMERFRTPAEEMAAEVQKINDAFARGILTQEQFGIVSQRVAEKAAETYAATASSALGNFSKAFEGIAGKNKELFIASKAFGIAQATIDTYIGANKALASAPPPLNFIAAAAVIAAGIANVIKISSQTPPGAAKGGSFIVPGGMSMTDNFPANLNLASGELVEVTPANEVAAGGRRRGAVDEITIGMRMSDFLMGTNLRDLVETLNLRHSDGYILRVAER